MAMKIIFFSSRMSFEADSLETRGLGGSESAMLNMAFALKKNFPEDEVIIYNDNSEKQKEYKGVIFRTITEFYSEVRTFDADILISLREPEIFYNLPYIDSKLKALWSQDICNETELQNLQKNKYGIENIDIIFANSKFSHDNIKEHFPTSNIRILRNGYNSDWLTNDKKEDVFVYTSTPFRGLNLLSEYWVEIYQKLKKYYDINAKLKIFGGMDLYNQSNDHFKNLYNRLSDLPNVEVFGSISQRELYKQLSTSKVMLYPCNYIETSCMAVLEALANKLWIISTDIGALGEQVDGNCGDLIKFTNQQEYKEIFIQSAIDSFKNSEKIKKIPNTVYSWNDQSKIMRNMIMEKLDG